MKKTVLAILALGTIAFVGKSFADRPFNPDCHLEGINGSIDSAIAQIKSSPAIGHAGGHYKNAVVELENVKKQLHEGCFAWNAGGKK